MNFPKFTDGQVAVKTAVIATNITMDIDNIYEEFEVTPYEKPIKKRTRKCKNKKPASIPLKNLPKRNLVDGDIISLKYKHYIKGVNLKGGDCPTIVEKTGKKKAQSFLNSASVVMYAGKFLNVKMTNKGTFQITGCKNDKHALDCVLHIWKRIKGKDNLCTFENKEDTKLVLLYMVTQNMRFNIGIPIDRDAITDLINIDYDNPNCRAIYNPVYYTGVRVYFSVDDDLNQTNIDKYTLEEDDTLTKGAALYKDYLDTIKPEERAKKLERKKNYTFLVFNSGKVIMIGHENHIRERIFNEFMDLVKDNHLYIKETIED
jgi:TATA-box binding protein (TBP) (component of TFIID and TFIIIB)